MSAPVTRASLFEQGQRKDPGVARQPSPGEGSGRAPGIWVVILRLLEAALPGGQGALTARVDYLRASILSALAVRASFLLIASARGAAQPPRKKSAQVVAPRSRRFHDHHLGAPPGRLFVSIAASARGRGLRRGSPRRRERSIKQRERGRAQKHHPRWAPTILRPISNKLFNIRHYQMGKHLPDRTKMLVANSRKLRNAINQTLNKYVTHRNVCHLSVGCFPAASATRGAVGWRRR
jgi:hypothetical protein